MDLEGMTMGYMSNIALMRDEAVDTFLAEMKGDKVRNREILERVFMAGFSTGMDPDNTATIGTLFEACKAQLRSGWTAEERERVVLAIDILESRDPNAFLNQLGGNNEHPASSDKGR